MNITRPMNVLYARFLSIPDRFLKRMIISMMLILKRFRNTEEMKTSSDNTDNYLEEISANLAGQKKILVSRCLYGGNPVRYDGRDQSLTDDVFLKWKEEGRLIPVCPEVDGGLPVPRLPSERSGEKVISLDGRDVTEKFIEGSVYALNVARKQQVVFAIMKENSPSCGSTYISDGSFTGKKIHGEGTAVEFLRNDGIIVFSENELEEAELYLAELEAEKSDTEKQNRSLKEDPVS